MHTVGINYKNKGWRVKITCRLPSDQELGLMMELGVMFWKESNFADFDLDAKWATKNAKIWRDMPLGYVRFYEVDGIPAGMFIGQAFQCWFAKDLQANDLIMFVLPAMRGKGLGRQMASDFLEWCNSRNVSRVTLSNSAGVGPQAHDLFEALGGEEVGKMYVWKKESK
jgi:GNAT superfamily N-acetyltransferase